MFSASSLSWAKSYYLVYLSGIKVLIIVNNQEKVKYCSDILINGENLYRKKK